MDAAALLHTLRGRHVVPLVENAPDRERRELDGETRHDVVGADVLVVHGDVQGLGRDAADVEVHFLVPARLQRVVDRARALALASELDDAVRVGF